MQGPVDSGDASDKPYFFLSYAHTPRNDPSDPDPDMWVARLYRDLCEHILQMTTLPAGVKAGFMDQGMNVGDGWPESLSEALANCSVFVPLYSPRYFRSPQCGKEWYAFSQRAVYHRAVNDSRLSGIVPALWVPMPPNALPAPAERLQFNHSEFGEDYAAEGFYGLIKLSYLRQEYERAVYRLAQRIVRVVEETRIARGRHLDYHHIPSAFGPPGASRSLRVTVLACSRSEELPEGRGPDCYGPSPRDWNPYHPHSTRPLADHAADLARNLDYRVSVGLFEEDAENLLDSGPPTAPGLLLLDRWALGSAHRLEMLTRFGAKPRPWMSVMVPWNRADPESNGQERKLSSLADQALTPGPAEPPGSRWFVHDNITSLEAFGDELPHAVSRAAKHYAAHAPAYPP
ncbi:TIR-like protein FxsC, partial [Streptomyces sp. GC420]|uniref:TIR-like protein FxsC n=1 Tax=Streptomyces sp. GC420 TaxID=2697568 RepID=UPI001414CF12